MSVIGKVVTRPFRLPFRGILLNNKQRSYSIIAVKLRPNYTSIFKQILFPKTFNKSFNIRNR